MGRCAGVVIVEECAGAQLDTSATSPVLTRLRNQLHRFFGGPGIMVFWDTRILRSFGSMILAVTWEGRKNKNETRKRIQMDRGIFVIFGDNSVGVTCFCHKRHVACGAILWETLTISWIQWYPLVNAAAISGPPIGGNAVGWGLVACT